MTWFFVGLVHFLLSRITIPYTFFYNLSNTFQRYTITYKVTTNLSSVDIDFLKYASRFDISLL